MQVPMLDLKAQYATIRSEIRPVLDEVCESQYFIMGPKVQAFEQNAAAYCGVREAIGLSSGTDALLVALMALDVGPGDAVLTTPYSFFATAGSIARLGAVPLFADIDPITFNLDPRAARKVLENPPARFRKCRIKVILPVHLYGQSADMKAFLDLAAEFKCRIVEDACQAIGAEYPAAGGARKVGAMGDIGCFSFFPSKNLGGFGDGGMATTNDSALAAKLKALRVHGSSKKYYHEMLSGIFRLDALQAVVLDVKLRHLDAWHAARRANAAFYDSAFKGTPVQAPRMAYAGQKLRQPHIYNQYVVRVPDRDRVRDSMAQAKIGCEVYYPLSLHQQECFRALEYRDGDFPESERAARETLALPIYPELTEPMKQAVVDALLKSVG